MKGKGKYFYIKERHNPQFKKPYYVAYGNTITAKDERRYALPQEGGYIHKT